MKSIIAATIFICLGAIQYAFGDIGDTVEQMTNHYGQPAQPPVPFDANNEHHSGAVWRVGKEAFVWAIFRDGKSCDEIYFKADNSKFDSGMLKDMQARYNRNGWDDHWTQKQDGSMTIYGAANDTSPKLGVLIITNKPFDISPIGHFDHCIQVASFEFVREVGK